MDTSPEISNNKNNKKINNSFKMKSMTCSLCLDYFNNPVQCIECEKAFCKECIKKWYLIKNNCPNGCKIDINQYKNPPKCFNDILEEFKLEDSRNLFEIEQTKNNENNENNSAEMGIMRMKRIMVIFIVI